MCADPKSAKHTVISFVFFALLGSVHIKAARKILVKLTVVVKKKEERLSAEECLVHPWLTRLGNFVANMGPIL